MTCKDDARVVRADLHLHSCHSGYTGHLRFLRARDCYSDPDALYAAAKARGMDLVTITDHDSIDGCLDFLYRHPGAADFFISEEVECRVPDVDLIVHIGAYDISEDIHRALQPLRQNVFEATGYLRREGVFFALNHPLFFFRGQLPIERYLDIIAEHFPAVEARNGTMSRAHNELIETIVSRWSAGGRAHLAATGGSDAHTLRGIGTTYTEAPGTNQEEFLASLRTSRGRVAGSHGGVLREAREIYGVVGDYWSALVAGSRPELHGRTRAVGLAFSLASMPFQFVPMLAAMRHKRTESRLVSAVRRALPATQCRAAVEFAPLPGGTGRS